MNPELLSRVQFGTTVIYHFFFVPLTLGLTIFVAIMESIYVRTGNVKYKDMAKFWGKLMLINFAVGVVTGLVMEFQFGMNWSEFSRFVGDVFGAPLAIEVLMAFMLESTFLGIWIFGWDRVPKGVHLAAMWLVALGSNLSAYWILVGNAFMQWPVAYTMQGGRPVLNDFFALITNPNVQTRIAHIVLAGLATAAFFIFGFSAYHMIRKKHYDFFNKSIRMAVIIGAIVILPLGVIGHMQVLAILKENPMAMIAQEGMWNTEDPAGLSIFLYTDQLARKNIVDVRLPYALSWLIYFRPSGAVEGINQIEAQYIEKYGPGYYIPQINITNYAFRIMLGLGVIMGLTLLYAVILMIFKKPMEKMWLFRFAPLLIFFPYLSNIFGWILAEMGRQPWIVFGLMQTSEGVTPFASAGTVWFTWITFLLVYAVLMGVDIYLITKNALVGPTESGSPALGTDEAASMSEV
jgi:cytochrome d ubiquinol oxidase subunit I